MLSTRGAAHHCPADAVTARGPRRLCGRGDKLLPWLQLSRRASAMTHLIVLALVLLTLIFSARSEAGSLSASLAACSDSQHQATLGEVEAIRIAVDYARSKQIDLANFEAPRAGLISAARGGKWRVFFIGKSHRLDSCFSIVVYGQKKSPRLYWCS